MVQWWSLHCPSANPRQESGLFQNLKRPHSPGVGKEFCSIRLQGTTSISCMICSSVNSPNCSFWGPTFLNQFARRSGCPGAPVSLLACFGEVGQSLQSTTSGGSSSTLSTVTGKTARLSTLYGAAQPCPTIHPRTNKPKKKSSNCSVKWNDGASSLLHVHPPNQPRTRWSLGTADLLPIDRRPR